MKKLRAIDLVTVNLYWLVLSFFLNVVGRSLQPVLVGALVEEGVRNSALGILRGTGLVVAIFIQPLIGWLSDRSTLRWGRRRPFILLGTLLDFVFLVAVAFSGEYLLLFLAVLFLQFSTNTAHGALQGLIPDLVPPEQRGKASGVKQVMDLGGLFLSFVPAVLFLNEADKLFRAGQREQALILVLMAVGTIIAVLSIGLILTLVLVRERPGSRGAGSEARAGIRDLFKVDIRANADYFWLVLGRLFIFTGVALATDFAYNFFRDEFPALDPVLESTKLGFIVVSLMLLVALPAGYLADRLGRKPLSILGGLVGAAGTLGLVTVTNQTIFTFGPLPVTDILVYVAIIGVAMGFFLSANWAWATDLVPKDEAGKFMGLMNLGNAGPGILSGFLGGPIIDFFNRQGPGLGYDVAFILGTATFIIGTLIMMRVRETKQKAALLTSEVLVE